MPHGPHDMVAHPIDALYRAHARALLAHCTHRLGNAALARDAVHDTFERVMRAHARERFDEAHAAPYLFRTATNICFDILRHQTVWRRIAPEFCDRTACPERGEPRQIERDYTRALCARLNALTLRIGLMHWVEEMSQQEVARELGLSRRSIFSHLKKLERSVLALEAESACDDRPTERPRVRPPSRPAERTASHVQLPLRSAHHSER